MMTAQTSTLPERKVSTGRSRVGACGSEARIQVLQALSAAEYDLSRAYLRNATQLDDDALTSVLIGLQKAGRIESTGRGKAACWCLPESVKAHRALMSHHRSARA
jgi:hypothetical protein